MNPYESPAEVDLKRDAFIDGGRLLRAGLLHRKIEFERPFQATFNYDGKYFRQRLLINRHLVWFCISWTVIHRRFEFVWPRDVDPQERAGRVEIEFAAGLSIHRFSVFLGDETIYDEVN